MRDVFICHASEDKDHVARPIVDAIARAGITCWFDEAEIKWGEGITSRVNHGLIDSRFILVIFSTAFMAKPWPKREFLAMLNLETTTGEDRVLPLLVGSPDEQIRFLDEFALLKDTSYLSWDGDPAIVVTALRRLLDGAEPATARRRVCHVSSEYPPRVYGGLGVHVEHLTKALGAHLDVDVVLPSAGNQEYQVLDPQVHPDGLAKVEADYAEPMSWLRFADFAAQRIIRRAKDRRPDVIHCHDWVTVLAGIECRWTLGIPLVMHLHLPNYSTLCASVENLGLICADRVTVNSEAMFEELQGRNLPLRQPPVVITNGVDVDVFRPDENWPDGDGYLLFVGRLVEQKGVEHLLRAFQYVRTKFPTVRLKIVGVGDLRDALERLATNLLVSDSVDFIDWISRRELVRLYQRAAVVAVPSIYEPFGMTALEALACGRPVVASREGGLRETVKHGVHGFLAEPTDELDLAQWLMALLADADLRNNMGAAGLEHVRNHYGWSDVADQYRQLYDELAGRPVDPAIPADADRYVGQIGRLAGEAGFKPVVLPRLFAGRDSA